MPEGRRPARFHLRRNRPSSAHVAAVVRESDGRAEAPEPNTWLPLPAPDSLPPVDELLAPTTPAEPEPAQEAPSSPARAEPHDATAWLPLPDVADLPPIHELLTPDPDAEPAAPPRDLPVGIPSPARAEPHDATAWLPLPEPDGLPHIADLVDNDGRGGATPPDTRTRRRRFHFPVRSVLVAALVIAMLGGVYWGGTRVLDKGDDVEVQVDGRVISTETGVSSVASLLKEQKVALGENDRVFPSADTPIENGMTVHVLRAFPVMVDVDGQERQVSTTRRDPQSFLKELALGPRVVFRDKPATIEQGASVVLRTRHTGTLTVDGQTVQFDSPSANVGELLQTYQVKLGPADFTTPLAVNEPLTDGTIVGVTRVASQTEQAVEPYTLPDERQPDPNLGVGEERVQEGKAGTQTVTYNVTVHNGTEAQRDAISKVPLPGQEAAPTITFFGTKYNPLWDKMAQCETGGNWGASGEKYQGGLGIYFQTWSAYGGRDFAPTAGQATKYEQIIVAERIRKAHGWRAWGCAKRIGL